MVKNNITDFFLHLIAQYICYPFFFSFTTLWITCCVYLAIDIEAVTQQNIRFLWRGMYYHNSNHLAQIQLGVYAKEKLTLPLDSYVSKICVDSPITAKHLYQPISDTDLFSVYYFYKYHLSKESCVRNFTP